MLCRDNSTLGGTGDVNSYKAGDILFDKQNLDDCSIFHDEKED